MRFVLVGAPVVQRLVRPRIDPVHLIVPLLLLVLLLLTQFQPLVLFILFISLLFLFSIF